ncbi:MAG: ABC transporter permease [bacterium]|nr:ABC transporter permease [bacterium]
MLTNYMRILLRSLLKSKFFSTLNILGLAIGMTGFLLIFKYVTFELSYDDFHENKNSIYRLQRDVYRNDNIIASYAQTSLSVGSALKAEFPEIKEVARCRNFSANTVTFETQVYTNEKIYITEPSFFKVFSFRMIQGDPEASLGQPNKILLSQSIAKKYFSTGDPMGKILKITNRGSNYTCQVSGIFEDPPENSLLKFDMLISFGTAYPANANNWVFSMFHTYLQLSPDADGKDLESKLGPFIKKYIVSKVPLASHWKFLLQPLKEIYLYSDITYDTANGNGTIVYFLLIIAFLILVISWINYVNLSTAGAMERAREVGIRKVLGGYRVQLIKQFLTESLFMNLIPIIISLVMVILLLPYLRELTGKTISTNLLADSGFWVTVVLLYIIGSLSSGLYPAFVLSSFKPVTMLKRSKFSHTSAGNILRKLLVGFQFAASVILIILTFTVYQQLSFMRSKELGIDVSRMLTVQLPTTPLNKDYVSNSTAFKTELEKYSAIEGITGSSTVPGSDPSLRRLVWDQRNDSKTGKIQSIIFTDEDFAPTYKLEFLKGRNFSKEFGTDRMAVLINEASAQLLGFKTPDEAVDKIISIFSMPGKFKVIGVLKNYHHQSLKKVHDPLIFRLLPAFKSYYSLKLSPSAQDTRSVISTVQSKWETIFPGYPFRYFFLDDHLDQQYRQERQFGKVLGIFVLLALLITCMGLLSLSYFSTVQRTKEIGVRKSFGAGVNDILMLFTKDIVKLVVISIAVAWPVAYLLIDRWLNDYANRIPMPFLLFFGAGVLVVLITLATTAYHTVTAAVSNPVNALRNE